MNAIKKTNPKRLLSMLLVLMMVLTMLPTIAWSADGDYIWRPTWTERTKDDVWVVIDNSKNVKEIDTYPRPSYVYADNCIGYRMYDGGKEYPETNRQVDVHYRTKDALSLTPNKTYTLEYQYDYYSFINEDEGKFVIETALTDGSGAVLRNLHTQTQSTSKGADSTNTVAVEFKADSTIKDCYLDFHLTFPMYTGFESVYLKSMSLQEGAMIPTASPSITQQPVDCTITNYWDPANFSVTAEGGGLHYAWYVCDANGATKHNLSTADSLQITGVRDEHGYGQYTVYCEISNAKGTVTSDKVKVIVSGEHTHSWGTGISYNADCTHGARCKYCGECNDQLASHTPLHGDEKKVSSFINVHGNREYWYCGICKKYYADESCKEPVSWESLLVHRPAHQDAVAATCTTAGTQEYWYCDIPDCTKKFSDFNLNNEITEPDTIPPLNHDWHYTASSNSITATCSRDASHSAVATVRANSAGAASITDTYCGTGTAFATTSTDADWNSYSLTTGDITYLRDGVETKDFSSTGTITAQIEVGGVTATATKTINPKTVTLNWSDLSVPYTGEAQLPSATVSNLESGDSCTVDVTGGQTNVGTHTATATHLNNSNYQLDDNAKTTKFTITQASNKWISNLSMGSWIYGETAENPNCVAKFGSPIYTYYSNADCGESHKLPTKPSDTGTYWVKGTIAETENYTGLTSEVASFSITKSSAPISITDVSENIIYDGAAVAAGTDFTLNTAGSTGSVTYEYKTGTGEWEDGLPTNAGSYQIRATVAADGNHTEQTSNAVSLTIEKKPIAVPAADTTVFAYTGAEQTYGITTTSDYTITGSTQINANETGYEVTVVLNDTGNTKWMDNTTSAKIYNFIIHKSTITITAANKSAYINSTAPSLANPVAGTDYTVTGLMGTDTLGGTVSMTYENTPDMKKAGVETINISGATVPNENNYSNIIKYVTGTLTIINKPSNGSGGSSTSTKTESEKAVDAIGKAQEGTTVEMKLTDNETTVDKEVFEALRGKDITLEIKSGDVTWTVNGKDIPENVNLSDLNLGVSMKGSSIPISVINAVTGEQSTIQLSIKHNGEFGFTMTLSAPLGEENSGLWANLYYFNPTRQALEFQQAAKIAGDGNAAFQFSHASDYAVVIDEKSHETAQAGIDFTDVSETDWFYDDVAYVFEKGLMSGTSSTTFSPSMITTRGMIVTVLYRQENSPSVTDGCPFNDVKSGMYYEAPIAWAAANGIVNGYSADKFGTDDPITREQMATILYRYAQYKGIDVSKSADLTGFTDTNSISGYALTPMQWANAEGLITGTNTTTIAPAGNATRGQTAAILHHFCENIAK